MYENFRAAPELSYGGNSID